MARQGSEEEPRAGRCPTRGCALAVPPRYGSAAGGLPLPARNTCAREAVRAAALPPRVAVQEAPAHSSHAHWVTGAGPPPRGAPLPLARSCQWGNWQREPGAEPRHSRVNRGSGRASRQGGDPPRRLPRHGETREGLPRTARLPLPA